MKRAVPTHSKRLLSKWLTSLLYPSIGQCLSTLPHSDAREAGKCSLSLAALHSAKPPLLLRNELTHMTFLEQSPAQRKHYKRLATKLPPRPLKKKEQILKDNICYTYTIDDSFQLNKRQIGFMIELSIEVQWIDFLKHRYVSQFSNKFSCVCVFWYPKNQRPIFLFN